MFEVGREREGETTESACAAHKCRVRISEGVILLLFQPCLINGGQNGAIVITNAVLSHNGRKWWPPPRPVRSAPVADCVRVGDWRGREEQDAASIPFIPLKSVSLSFHSPRCLLESHTHAPKSSGRRNDAGFPNAMDTMILGKEGCFCRRPNQNLSDSVFIRGSNRPLRRLTNEPKVIQPLFQARGNLSASNSHSHLGSLV